MELLWPGVDLDGARNRLNVALSSLRPQLEPPGVPEGSVLVTDRFTVRLNPETVTTDAVPPPAHASACAPLDSEEGYPWLNQCTRRPPPPWPRRGRAPARVACAATTA